MDDSVRRPNLRISSPKVLLAPSPTVWPVVCGIRIGCLTRRAGRSDEATLAQGAICKCHSLVAGVAPGREASVRSGCRPFGSAAPVGPLQGGCDGAWGRGGPTPEDTRASTKEQ